MKKCFIAICFVMFGYKAFCQVEISERPNLSDTVLKKNRTLFIRDSLNPAIVLQKLFPGKKYNLDNKSFLISWQCKKCIPNKYPDVNGVEGDQQFPYEEGVATRLINVIDYTDAAGSRYKLLSFNHSEYDTDGLQTGRFSGGLLGVAKFRQIDGGWEMRSFEPAIAAFGAFSQCPAPQPLQIGNDQYAFIINHSNGAAGGPYNTDLYLIAGINGSYKPIPLSQNVERFNVDKKHSAWNYTVNVVNDMAKKNFSDIQVKITGKYYAVKEANPEDFEDDFVLPELEPYTKNKKQFQLVIDKVYTFKNNLYQLKSSKVTVK